jgi:hypothetical protein
MKSYFQPLAAGSSAPEPLYSIPHVHGLRIDLPSYKENRSSSVLVLYFVSRVVENTLFDLFGASLFGASPPENPSLEVSTYVLNISPISTRKHVSSTRFLEGLRSRQGIVAFDVCSFLSFTAKQSNRPLLFVIHTIQTPFRS